MKTDPLTSHAAQVLARMKQQKRDDRADARVLRFTVAADRALWPANKTYQEA